MKQKYLILNEKKNNQIKIQEFAELDKETLSLLCEEAYDHKTIAAAISEGKDRLISALRTNNMYPPGIYAEKIAEAVMELHASKDKDSMELYFDDTNLLSKKRGTGRVDEQLDDDSADLDDILEDDFDESYEEKDELKKGNSSFKIADDDFGDIDEDD
jgi:hypothetical protein